MVKVQSTIDWEVNNSRFGKPRKGEVLCLTDNEWLCVSDDKRYVLLTDPPSVPIPGEVVPDPKAAEEGRAETVQVLGSERVALQEEIRQLKVKDLFEKAKSMGIEVRKNSDPSAVRRQVLDKLGLLS